MQTDIDSLENDTLIESDICIIGAGPAGLTLAHEFIGTNFNVSLLESGGLSKNLRTQKLSEGTLSGDLSEPIDQTHIRQVGGTANHWIIKMADKRYGYRYAPFDEIDFKKREGLPYSGWPIQKTDLDAYYAKALTKCEIGPYQFNAESWNNSNTDALRIDTNKIISDVFMFGPTKKFTQDFPTDISKASNINLFINATVVELLTSKCGSFIEIAVVKTFTGKIIRFKANQFILATNALQTPRLLLNSRKTHLLGIGNQHDNVGRYYMDHSLVPSGNFYLHDPKTINNFGFYDMRLLRGTSVLGKLKLSKEVMQKQQLRNFAATLFPMPAFKEVEALFGAKYLLEAVVNRKAPLEFKENISAIYKAKLYLLRILYEKLRYDTPIMPGFGRGGWSKLANNEKKYKRIELLAFAEQSPNPNNRITLINEGDELGCKKINLHFKWGEDDITSIKKTQKIFADSLNQTGLGRFELPDDFTVHPNRLLGLHHMMGTCRMSESPKDGVVDKNCKVFGMQNLYIAGSAVFTTGGYANPTLTNLALSLRVADIIKQEFAEAARSIPTDTTAQSC